MGPKNQSWIHKLPTSQSHRNARLLVHLMEFSLNSHSGSVMDFTMKHKPAKLALILRNTDFLAGNSKFYQLPISANRRFSRKTMDFVPKIVAVAKKNSKNIEGVSQELNSIASEKLDFAPARRRVRTAFFEAQQQLDHPLFQLAHLGIRTEEWFERNSKGVEIFCKSWLPKQEVKIKAIVCFCHGYGDTCTFFFDGIAKRIAESGYAVYAIDHPGFGLSEGLHGYIPSFDELVNNVIERYTNIKARPEASGLPQFLLGQSMGGAVAIKAHLKQPTDWDGVVLVAPMCKIAEDVKPAPAVVKILTLISNILPEAKLVPENHLGDLAFRETSKKKMADYNVISYSDQMRLKTAMELLKATKEIESQLEKVSSPLLVLHGAADKVTDPSVSKFLYEKASSKDKTLKLYPEGYHCILEGEPDERIFTVLGDIVAWLDSRCAVK